MPSAGIQTVALAKVIPIPTPPPKTISNDDEKGIDHEVINNVSDTMDTFENILNEINKISEATVKKICRAEENCAAQDIIEVGAFGYLDSACTAGVVTESDQEYLRDTGEISTKEFVCPQGDI